MRRALHVKIFLFFWVQRRGEGPRDLIIKMFPQLNREAAKGLSQPQSVIIFFTAKGVISLTFMYTQMRNRFQHYFFLIPAMGYLNQYFTESFLELFLFRGGRNYCLVLLILVMFTKLLWFPSNKKTVIKIIKKQQARQLL